MLNDQQRPLDGESEPVNVVVTNPAPVPPPVVRVEREEPVPEATRVEVYPPRTETPVDRLVVEREVPPLLVRPDVIREQRYGIGKIIDFCWYLLGVLEILLAARFFFKLTAANSSAGFVTFIYGITAPFTWPFNNIFPIPHDGNNVFDTNIIVAMVVYLGIFWGITRLLAMTIEPPSVR